MRSESENLDALVAEVRDTQLLPEPHRRREIRQNHRVSVRRLARALNVAPQTVAAWEAGSVPRPERANEYRRLLEALEQLG